MSSRTLWSILALSGALAACSAKTSAPTAIEAAAGATSPAGASIAGASAAAAESAQSGERLFSGNCVSCHQPNGAGIKGVYPSLKGSPVVLGDPAELARWVIEGRRPASMPAGRYPTQMLQFGWMKPEQAAALFTYIRSNFGNSAPPVDAATVARALGP
ncbi:MAG TPA: cytochrome c [Steroidobacteraceae bacterium]|nr:cytochrome c [Steroidobacteraceae bacterium]